MLVQHPHQKGKPAGELYLYSHWGGEYLPCYVQQTLAKRQRWDDETYLARRLFSALVGDDLDGDSGVGISTYLTDTEFPLLVIDTENQRVTLRDLDREAVPEPSWTFEEFVELPLDEEQPWNTLGYGYELPTRRFEFFQGNSNKFWEITLEGEEHSVRFGRIGTAGQSHTKSFDDEEEARKDYLQLIAEKIKKGYVEVAAGAPE